MKLTLNKFHVQDIQFAEASSFCSGVLYINKAELAEYLMEIPISAVWILI